MQKTWKTFTNNIYSYIITYISISIDRYRWVTLTKITHVYLITYKQKLRYRHTKLQEQL